LFVCLYILTSQLQNMEQLNPKTYYINKIQEPNSFLGISTSDLALYSQLSINMIQNSEPLYFLTVGHSNPLERDSVRQRNYETYLPQCRQSVMSTR